MLLRTKEKMAISLLAVCCQFEIVYMNTVYCYCIVCARFVFMASNIDDTIGNCVFGYILHVTCVAVLSAVQFVLFAINC